VRHVSVSGGGPSVWARMFGRITFSPRSSTQITSRITETIPITTCPRMITQTMNAISRIVTATLTQKNGSLRFWSTIELGGVRSIVQVLPSGERTVRAIAADHTTAGYSHSIVDGGFDEMSSATRFTPGISLMIRLEIVSSRSYGSRAQSAVIASSDVTARITIGYA
jgi:hypothetical protein